MKLPLFLVFILLYLVCPAQDQGFFRQIWLDQGLSQSSITAIAQDPKGFMWFGTQDGLNRYDGRRIEKFNFEPFSKNSISADDIAAILPLNEENLWVVSREGIDELNTKTNKIRKYYPSATAIKTGQYNEIFSGWLVNKKIYLFSRQGFFEVNKINDTLSWKRKKLLRLPGKEKRSLDITAVCANAGGDIFVSTSEGIFYGAQNADELQPVQTQGLASRYIMSFVINGDELIAGCENELIFYHTKTKKTSSQKIEGGKEAEINTLLTDKKGKLWVGTAGSGLWVFEKKADYWTEGPVNLYKHFMRSGNASYGLNCDFISRLFQSDEKGSEDLVWIGSRDGGAFLYSYAANSFSLLSAKANVAGPNFFSIVQDSSKNLWAGTHSGLLKLEAGTGTASFFNLSYLMKETMRAVEAVYTDSSGKVWIGIANRLYTLNTKTGKPEIVEEEVLEGKRNVILRISALSKNELLIGSDRAVVFYNTATRQKKAMQEISVNGETVKMPGIGSFYIDKTQNLWLATHWGLLMINRNDEKKNKWFKNDAADKNSLLSNVVMHLCAGENGELLVATTKGLSILEKPGDLSFTNYHSVPGLANNFIYGMLKGNGHDYWMSTNYGISVFDLEKRSFRTYTATDGTYINEFNSGAYLRTKSGVLFFGGLGGLIGLHPSEMMVSKSPPAVVFTGATIGNVEYENEEQIRNLKNELSYQTDNLKFRFSILDFAGASHSKLMYRLAGADKELHELSGEGQLQISFTNLAPGNYSLEVFAVNAEGVSSTDTFKFPFSIATPFWNRAWFYVLIVLLVATGSFLLYRMRLNNKLQRLAQLERVRQEENERVRKAAALDLHDEFGNGLTRISMLVETAKMKMPAENAELKNILSNISENSSRLYNGTKDFIWSINPGNDNLYETIIRIKDFADEVFYGSGTDFKVEGLQDYMKEMKHPPGTGRNLVMIFKEGLSNIVKHAAANNVRLLVEKRVGRLSIALIDNGKGFDTENCSAKKRESFGLGNMKQRAQKCGAEMEIKAAEGGGTHLELKFNTELKR